jgi:hypothetical protein
MTIDEYVLEFERELHNAIPLKPWMWESYNAFQDFVRKSKLEVETHLSDRTQALQTKGFPSSEAEALAIQEFGPARQIAYAMAEGWKLSVPWIVNAVLEVPFILTALLLAVFMTGYPISKVDYLIWAAPVLLASCFSGSGMLGVGIASRTAAPRLQPKALILAGLMRLILTLAMMAHGQDIAVKCKFDPRIVVLFWAQTVLYVAMYWAGTAMYIRSQYKRERIAGMRP